MLTSKIVSSATGTTVYLKGIVDEHTNFETCFKDAKGSLDINCKEITKINSAGVKAWINFFTYQSKKTSINFVEMSLVLVEQLNSLSNFAAGGTIESIEVPYICTSKNCRKEFTKFLKISELRKNKEITNTSCPQCKSESEFDDLPEEYLAFLEFLND